MLGPGNLDLAFGDHRRREVDQDRWVVLISHWYAHGPGIRAEEPGGPTERRRRADPGSGTTNSEDGHQAVSSCGFGVVADASKVVCVPDCGPSDAVDVRPRHCLTQCKDRRHLPEASRTVYKDRRTTPADDRWACRLVDHARCDLLCVLRDADGTVTVVPGEIGPHQMTGDLGRDVLRCAKVDENAGCGRLERCGVHGAVVGHGYVLLV